jgi:multidrug resistance protein
MYNEVIKMQPNKEGLLTMDKNQKLALLVVFIAIFTDMLIYCMIVPILPDYASELGASQQLIGLLFACYAITFLLVTPVVGVLSDRVGRKLPMVCGLIGLFGSTLLFAFSSDLTMLFIARALQGVSAGATWTAGLALLSDMFPSKTRQQAIGIGISGSFAGTLLGPLFGGLLYEYGGYTLPFLAAYGLVLIDGAARLLSRRRGTQREGESLERHPAHCPGRYSSRPVQGLLRGTQRRGGFTDGYLRRPETLRG